MEPTSGSRTRWLWLIALGLPILAGVITWVLTDATTSVAMCHSGGDAGIGAAGWALVLTPPLMTAAYGRRERNHWFRVAAATITAAVLSVFFLFIADQSWWISHNCIGSIVS
jgi:hypothetical protein